MNIIKYRKFFIGFSLVLVLVSLLIVGVRGLTYGTEFTGGSVLEVSYTERPAIEDMKQTLSDAGFLADIQSFGDNAYIIKTGFVSEEERKNLVNLVSDMGTEASVERFNAIGPSVGRELRTKSLYALIFVSLGIVLFIAYAFRKVSQPVSSWKYGVVAVIALLHDIIIPVGILTLFGYEIDTLYVVGLLSILGLSVNDTIVVFDRIRENVLEESNTMNKESFMSKVGHAIKDTMTRSIMTSLTLVVVLIALYFFGPVATRTLALVLLLGTIIGTYSSIFLASPLLTTMVSTKKK